MSASVGLTYELVRRIDAIELTGWRHCRPKFKWVSPNTAIFNVFVSVQTGAVSSRTQLASPQSDATRRYASRLISTRSFAGPR